MVYTRRRFLGTAVGTLPFALAGCTSDAGSDGDSDGETTTAPSSTTATRSTTTDSTTNDASKAVVQTRSHPEHGDILTDAEGMTLYVFDKDGQGAGASACYDGCASAWPPLTVEVDPTKSGGVSAEVTTFERETGEMQVAAGGWPLYYFDSDEQPGDAKGQGVNDVWWVLAPDGTPLKPDSTTTSSGGVEY